jgi:hypothetical protein
MMDHVLPWPDPDRGDPTPSDAPSIDQTSVLAQVYGLSQRLPQWLAVAATGQLPPRRWRELVTLLAAPLTAAMQLDTDPVTEYEPAKITVHPHRAEPDADGELCGRCGLKISDSIHES